MEFIYFIFLQNKLFTMNNEKNQPGIYSYRTGLIVIKNPINNATKNVTKMPQNCHEKCHEIATKNVTKMPPKMSR